MKEYKKISMKQYCVEKVICSCNNCKNEFADIIPFGYELVCFDKESIEKVFLPTYGKNGYLDLLKKLIPEWNESDEITCIISKKFEEKINCFTPYKVVQHNKTICPKCRSTEITISERKIKENYPINWMEIDAEVLT